MYLNRTIKGNFITELKIKIKNNLDLNTNNKI